MRIEPLSQHKGLISVMASRLHAEWGDLPPWDTTARIEARLEQGACTQVLPHTLVGIDQNGKWTSTGSVKLRELPHHPDKEHWVGEIFVLPAYRGQGLGSALTILLAEYAFGHGVSQLFLYTPDQQALYRRLGWKDICQDVVHNESVSVMALTLSAHRARRRED